VDGVTAWPTDRDGVQHVVRERAAALRDRAIADPEAQLRSVPPLRLATPNSVRPGVTTVRRVLQRLVAWELDPLVGQVNRLRVAALQVRPGADDQRTGDGSPSADTTTSA